MANKGSWYFDGYEAHYEVGKNGKKKRVLTYTGEKYGIYGPVPVNRVRLLVTLDIVLLTAILLLINFFPGTGGMFRWVAIPCIWALIPLIFLYVGLYNFLTCGEKWMIRQYYAGYRRIARWAIAELVLMAFVTAAHIVFLFLYPDLFPSELYYTFGALACTALAAALVYMTRKWPAYVVEGPVIK